MNNFPYPDIELMQLTKNSVVVNMENEFILIDNVDNEHDTTGERMKKHPVRLSFSIAIFCLEGNIKFRLNLNEFSLGKNDILLIRKGMIGEFLGASVDCRVAAMAWNDNYFQINDKVDASITLQQILRTNPVCHLGEKAFNECLTIYRLLKEKIQETDNSFRRGAVMGYMQVITYNAYHYLLSNTDAATTPTGSKVRHQEIYNQFIREVQENYVRERAISFYADRLCVTPKYLSQVVKQISGRLAGEWISDYVILEAKALINSHKYTMQQISDMLNFANQSFFAKYFKEKVGCSPSKYLNS
jgi:AraC-like DNA-binding protein